jgi:hypothetical protein
MLDARMANLASSQSCDLLRTTGETNTESADDKFQMAEIRNNHATGANLDYPSRL